MKLGEIWGNLIKSGAESTVKVTRIAAFGAAPVTPFQASAGPPVNMDGERAIWD